MKPLCIDLFCGLGGWTEGFLSEGYDVVGFDIEREVYGPQRYPAQLVLQDVLTLHGSQFRDAACIVASPPCQNYSYIAMPWSRAKAMAAEIRQDAAKIEELNRLFNACSRLQLEASQAAGRHIPLVVENVKGAQPWVGRAAWHFGSFYLWGDVPALMPNTLSRKPDVLPVLNAHDDPRPGRKNVGGSWFAQAHNTESGYSLNPVTGEGVKVASASGRRTDVGNGVRFTSRDCGIEGVNQHGSGPAWFDSALDERRKEATAIKVSVDWFGSYAEQKAAGTISPGRLHGKGSPARKAASAQIAKIPFELASYIARVYKPDLELQAVG